MSRKSFLLHTDALDFMDEMSDDEVGRVFRAIRSHVKGDDYQLERVERLAFLPIKNSLDRDDEKYENIVAARKIAGSKGGKQRVANQAKGSKLKQTVANQAVNVNVSDNVSVSDSVNVSESVSVSVFAKRSYLTNLPEQDIAELAEKFTLSRTAVTAKAEQLSDWLESTGKRYKNYKAFLRSALNKDAVRLRKEFPDDEEPDDPQTEAAWRAWHEETELERLLGPEAHGR